MIDDFCERWKSKFAVKEVKNARVFITGCIC